MSKTQQNAQSKNPLGGGEKTEASGSNRILYALLIILVGIFIWKMASQDKKTQIIDIDKSSPKDMLFDLTEKSTTPSVEVEIQEADFKEVTTTIDENEANHSSDDVVVEDIVESSNEVTHSQPISSSSTNDLNEQDNISSESSYAVDTYSGNAEIRDDYSYIYTSKVELPQGSYSGLDNDGFARANQVNIDVAVSQFDGATGTLQRIPEEDLYASEVSSNTIQPTLNPPVKKEIQYPTYSNNNGDKEEEYPSTGIPYGTETYPLKDTLAWHPYESLAYMREEKETFVAEKVRNMPTADDLEPYVPPSTIGDRDTRMGFGVVIRPNK